MQVKQFEPWFTGEEYAAIKECFDANWITEGPQSKAFVEELKAFIDVPYAVLAPNGTLALYMALRALGIKPGDEVLVPDFTFIGSATAIEMCGATPVFCDVDPMQFQLDLVDAAKRVTSKTVAIMPVHIYGAMVDMETVTAFAAEHGLKTIEDAAQAIGIRRRGRHAGTTAQVGCFSFFADKSLTTGEGGLVVTSDPEIYDQLRYLRNQGRLDRGSYVHPRIGYNFRMTDLQAAVGRVQLRRQPEIVAGKQRVLARYRKSFEGLPLRILGADAETTHIPIRVSVVLEDVDSKWSMPMYSARACEAHLAGRGVESRSFYYPLHRQPAFAYLDNAENGYPVATQAYDSGIMLPSYPTLTDLQVDFVSQELRKFCGR